MISGGVEVKWLAYIRLLLEAKFLWSYHQHFLSHSLIWTFLDSNVCVYLLSEW